MLPSPRKWEEKSLQEQRLRPPAIKSHYTKAKGVFFLSFFFFLKQQTHKSFYICTRPEQLINPEERSQVKSVIWDTFKNRNTGCSPLPFLTSCYTVAAKLKKKKKNCIFYRTCKTHFMLSVCPFLSSLNHQFCSHRKTNSEYKCSTHLFWL